MRSYELATNSQNSYELPWECVVVGIVGLMFAVLISIGNNYFKTSRGGKSLSFEFWLILTPNKSIFNLGQDSAARLDTHLIWMWATAVLCNLCMDPRLWCDATSCCSSSDWIYFFCFTKQVLCCQHTGADHLSSVKHGVSNGDVTAEEGWVNEH